MTSKKSFVFLIFNILLSWKVFSSEIILQGFNWESYAHSSGWFNHLNSRVVEISDAHFTTVWLPPVSLAYDGEGLYPHSRGYMPQEYYNLDSAYGNEGSLRVLINNLKKRGVSPMADLVLNHRMFSSKDDAGNFIFRNPDWGLWAFTGGDGMIGQGAPDTGDAINYAFDIDWTNTFLQDYFTDWVGWLKEDIGFESFRYDFVKGFAGKYIALLNKRTSPKFTIGEYWRDMNHGCQGRLCYGQDPHRQGIINWIDKTWKGSVSSKEASTAFDFTTKGILQEAIKTGEFWRLKDTKGRPPGLLGLWPEKAVTFIDNHDTGSTQNHWPFGNKEQVMQGYAYILTHPGIPCVFWDHYFDWGLDKQIKKLNKLRLSHKLTSSKVSIEKAKKDLYAAYLGEKVALKIGPRAWKPQGPDWKLYLSGHHYAVWTRP